MSQKKLSVKHVVAQTLAAMEGGDVTPGVWAKMSVVAVLRNGGRLSDFHRMALVREKTATVPEYAYNRLVNDLLDENNIQETRRNWSKLVLSVVRKYITPQSGFSAEEIEDTYQQVFATLFADGGQDLMNKFDPSKGQFYSFFMRSVQNAVVDVYRAAKREKRGPDAEHVELMDGAMDLEDGLLNAFEDVAGKDWLREVYRRLKERARSASVLQTFAGLSQGMKPIEIARATGLSPAAITRHMSVIRGVVESM